MRDGDLRRSVTDSDQAVRRPGLSELGAGGECEAQLRAAAQAW